METPQERLDRWLEKHGTGAVVLEFGGHHFLLWGIEQATEVVKLLGQGVLLDHTSDYKALRPHTYPTRFNIVPLREDTLAKPGPEADPTEIERSQIEKGNPGAASPPETLEAPEDPLPAPGEPVPLDPDAPTLISSEIPSDEDRGF